MAHSFSRGRVETRRTCDLCGGQRAFSDGRTLSGRWVCYDHANYKAPETLDRLKPRTFPPKAIKNAKPFNPRDTFERAEGELMDFLLANYRYDAIVHSPQVTGLQTEFLTTASIEGSSGAIGAGWTAIYLYELIREGLRPVATITRARAGLKEIADWLLTRICAYPGRPGAFTTADFAWGGFELHAATTGKGSFYTLPTASAGLALLRAYQVLGTATYLDAARAAAWHCRSLQCGGYLAAVPHEAPTGGARMHYGAFEAFSNVDVAGTTLTFFGRLHPSGLLAAEFFQALKDVVGDEVVGSSSTAGFFSQSRETMLSTAIAEAKSFWTTGAWDAVRAATINGFSTATPFERYLVPPNGAATGTWSRFANGSNDRILGYTWAQGIRALTKIGATSQAEALFDWLTTVTADSADALPTRASAALASLPAYTDATLWAGAKGTLDPKVATPFSVVVVDGSGNSQKVGGDSAYHLGAVGLMANLYSRRQQASFAQFKQEMNTPRPRSAGGLEDSVFHYLATMGRCGLSWQPRTGPAVQRRSDVYAAAMAGLIYREEPRAFMGRGH